ncbi:transporter [Pseudoponticoccus marisrubri]|uniref:Transporter n=2 Tax=Pseudoponticoccus marisrubri TaxID=1685382 RepID=A0A0W7WIM1_9RHOB|nr:TolC family outer membrane protein [Pseudoponticoccus marisrubri]KUF10426.1 transporter [Pseudoponticoccus marisrubri]
MGTAVSVQAETLGQSLTSAYEHSGLIEQNRAVLRAADEGVAQAVAALRPVISWSGNVRRQFGRTGTISAVTGQLVTRGSATNDASINLIARLVLFNGGRNKLQIDAAKETVLATRSDLVAIEQQVLLRAVFAFMEVRRAIETVSLRQNNIRVIRQEVRAARDRFEVGEVTRTDVALAEARLSQAQSALAAAEGALVSAREEYRAVVGRYPGGLVPPGTLPRLPASVDAAKAQAVRMHPDMLAARHRVAAAELGVLIAEGAKKPTVSLQGQYGVTESFDDRTFSRGGSISLNAEGPIYQGGGLASAVREAMANRDQARAGLHVLRFQLEQNVGDAYVQLRVARASRDSFREQVRAATVAFQGVREEAKLGARTTLDVLDAEQELLDARASLISAQVDETRAAYQVLATIGQLTADKLQLRVPQYDPAAYYNLVKDAPAGLSKQGRELDRVLRALGKD